MTNNNQSNKQELDPVAKKAATVVGITLLVLGMAIVVALVYKVITWILGI